MHGDYLTTAGPKSCLDWLESTPEAHYELKRSGRLGPGHQDDKEATVLNRGVRWTPQGLEYEADPRQAEKLLEAIDLDGANSVAKPGLEPLAEQIL